MSILKMYPHRTFLFLLFTITHIEACFKDPILVHAIFRHGDRTIDNSSIYPNDPYKNEQYFPYGIGQLTNLGKMREYKLGKYLRNRYNRLLGDIYTPQILDARSTDVNRTKMSLELVLASLFPPKGIQKWHAELDWQPIPYNYWPMELDRVLFGLRCPNFQKYYQDSLKKQEVQEKLTQHKDTLKYLSENSGWNVTSFAVAFNLYFGLVAEDEWGFVLPEWTKNVYPEPLQRLAIEEYFIRTGNLQLKQLAAGYFLQKIVADTKAKIKGTLAPIDRTLFLYSAHDMNIATLLRTLDVFEPHIPPYGSCIMIEVHRARCGFGIKIYYEDYSSNQPALLKLPKCDELCPLDQFISIVEKYFPPTDLCGNQCLN